MDKATLGRIADEITAVNMTQLNAFLSTHDEAEKACVVEGIIIGARFCGMQDTAAAFALALLPPPSASV
jgi:hypothetical protein